MKKTEFSAQQTYQKIVSNVAYNKISKKKKFAFPKLDKEQKFFLKITIGSYAVGFPLLSTIVFSADAPCFVAMAGGVGFIATLAGTASLSKVLFRGDDRCYE